ncbi:MAG: hypothetical protein QM651_07950 [Rhodoblastus sp.]
MDKFTFSKSAFFLASDVDETSVELSWDIGGTLEVYIWYRINASSWVRAVPPYPKPFDYDANAWKNKGNVSLTSGLGVVEALVSNLSYYDPNGAGSPLPLDPPPVHFASCYLLRSNRAPLVDGRIITNWSGTYFSVLCHQDHDPLAKFDERTFARLEIGKDQPVQADDAPSGFLRFKNPPILWNIDPYNMDHGLMIADPRLYPGNTYWALLTLTNQVGDWDFYTFKFTLRQRKVVFTFDEIHIINDGSEQHNDAAFHIWLTEGWGWNEANHVYIPQLEISDRPSPGEEGMEHIKLNGPHRFSGPITIGPRVIVPEQDDPHASDFDASIGNERIAALAYGIAEGDGIDGSDRTANFELPHVLDGRRPLARFVYGFLHFPVGPDEELTDEPFYSRARPDIPGENEFIFALIGSYSVTYE